MIRLTPFHIPACIHSVPIHFLGLPSFWDNTNRRSLSKEWFRQKYSADIHNNLFQRNRIHWYYYIYTPTTNSNTIVIRCLKKFIRIFFPICILFFRTKSLKWAMNKLYPRLKKKKTLEIFTEWMEKKILVHIKQF